MAFSLSSNLAEMSYCPGLSLQLGIPSAQSTFFSLLESMGQFNKERLNEFLKQSRPVEACLLDLGNAGYTVKDLIYLLAKAKLDKPQLSLHRRFEPIKIKKTISSKVENIIHLLVIAASFPSPKYQWYKDEELLEGSNDSKISINTCCASPGNYWCKIRNEIEAGEEWSDFYRQEGKQFASSANSKPFVLDPPTLHREYCSRCAQEKILERLSGIFSGELDSKDEYSPDDPDAEIATDKIALIIANSQYHHMSSLLTPPCDAEVLADELMKQDFKTVVLSDLSLSEMKDMIYEYKKLLGKGVYAVFYFVGHGFEVHGKCFLIPVDAPAGGYLSKDCLSIDWVLREMQDTHPALNLILLDICRKYPPRDAVEFVDTYSGDIKPNGNRNTVFGYATSKGVGAYEVKGEENGVFMKYLKNYIGSKVPVEEMLRFVLRDLEMDEKASEVQFPEFRSNLSRTRKLTDPLRYAGHTNSFDVRTISWRLIHEFPDPTHVFFHEQNLKVVIWFDFFGHFTNMVYVFSSVTDPDSHCSEQSDYAKQHLCFLSFGGEVENIQTKVCNDASEGISVRSLLRKLQRVKGTLAATVELRNSKTDSVVASQTVEIGGVLITRLGLLSEANDTEEGEKLQSNVNDFVFPDA